MLETLLTSLVIILYCVLTALLIYRLASAGRGPRKPALLGIGLLGLLCHGYLLYARLFADTGLELSFFTVFSLVTWVITAMLLFFAWRLAVENLLIGVLPIAVAAVLLRLLSQEHFSLPQHLDAGLQLHILVSIISYSLLSIAALQAILLYVQDMQLHNKHPAGFIRALPPLETMEHLLFRLIAAGFIVLSVSLLSGLFYLEDIFGQHLVHKTVLSLGAWLLFAILLWGRWRFGWRGATATRWTLTGFALLLLAYFGSKFVIELVLTRSP